MSKYSILSGRFNALKIEYFDMPESIRDSYQYVTEADMSKLLATGCPYGPLSLEEGIEQYVKWLQKENKSEPLLSALGVSAVK